MATAVRSTPRSVLEEVVYSASSTAEISVASASKTGIGFYQAGDEVPAPGSYWVWHKHHRQAHAAKVRFTVFPQCAQCGDSVRYLPINESRSTATEWLRRDPDFQQALIRKGRRKEPLG